VIGDQAEERRRWLIDLLYRGVRKAAPPDDQLYKDAIEAALEFRRQLNEEKNPKLRVEIAGSAITLWTLLTADLAGGAFAEFLKNPPEAQDEAKRRRDLMSRVRSALYLIDPYPRSFDPPPAPALDDLHSALADGVRALERGEGLPLLKRAPARRDSEADNWDLARTIALEHVHFLAGQGHKKGEAQRRVARTIGVNARTLREWEKRDLPKIYGPDILVEFLEETRQAGALKARRDADPDLRKRPVEWSNASAMRIIETIAAEPLEAFGKRFRASGFAERSWNPEK
jgi:hypothetical protein